MAETLTLIERFPNLRQISIIGHSLGGMFSRFMMSELPPEILEKYEFVMFLTIASPHLGVRRRQSISDPFNLVFQTLASNAPYFRSAHELCMSESRPEGVSPLIHRMATTEKFLKPLRLFRHRICYSNAFSDFQVPCHTASIRPFNPYSASKRSNLKGLPDFRHVIQAMDEIHDISSPNFQHDPMGPYLTEMLGSLHSLGWQRYDVMYRSVRSHEWIVGKNISHSTHRETLRHIAQTALQLSPVVAAAEQQIAGQTPNLNADTSQAAEVPQSAL